MLKKNLVLVAAVAGAVAVLSLPALTTAVNKPATKVANDGRAKCYECHDEVKALKEGSKHAKLSCKTCHDKLDAHMTDPEKNKPLTIIDQAMSGKWHKSQYESFFKVNYDGGARKEKGAPTGRSPMQDKLLAPYGFTFEHNEPRGHAYMVIDQFAVDRFQGGRFQFKDGWRGAAAKGKTWDVLVDKAEGHKDWKPLPQSAMAGN